MSQHPHDGNLFDEIHVLVTARSEGTATPEQSERLKTLLGSDESARALYVRYIQETVALRKMAAAEVSGRALAPGNPPARSASEESTHHAPRDVCQAGNQHALSTPQLSSDHALQQPVASDTQTHHAERDGYYGSPHDAQRPLRSSFVRTFTRSAREVVLHPIALVLLVGVIAAAVIIYQFSTAPTSSTVAAKPPIIPPAGPAATLTGATDAQWLGEFPTQGKALPPGQRLVLERGSATVAFSSQARVVFDAPVQFEIVDQNACRLSAGRLTAQVPDPAKGFKVLTPTGTITDLGTEFGVYVRSEALGNRLEAGGEEEQEQPPPGAHQVTSQFPMTEVHVFQGKVELTQAPEGDIPKSQIPNPKSQIVSAGQAVTISENKVQPLPAADPFKFALDKLNGKPRQVLLSEDFESYEVGAKRGNLGEWIIQSGTRKGQGVVVENFDKVKEIVDQHGLADKGLVPWPDSIAQVLRFSPSAPNPPDTFPRLIHAIDAPQLAHTCQVLVEFVLISAHATPEPSLAFATEAGPAPGVEFWRNADATAPRLPWQTSRCYRLRILLDVVEGKLREARVSRSAWRGNEGWVRDADYQTPVPKVDWTTPPRFVIFGYPTVTPQTPWGIFSIDNIRIEVIAEN